MPKSNTVDRDSIEAAYEDVRSDVSDTAWAIFTYTDKEIAHGASGVAYDEFLEKLTDDERVFAYVRLTTGDELSKRAKFAFITWIGPNVSPMDKARVSTDKMLVKEIITNFAKEILAEELGDVTEEHVRAILAKASGAAYGTGVRD